MQRTCNKQAPKEKGVGQPDCRILHPSLPVYTLLEIKGMITLILKEVHGSCVLNMRVPNFEDLKEEK